MNRREIDTGFFKNAALFQDPRSATAAALARPDVFPEALAIEFLDRSSDSILKFLKMSFSPFAPSHIL